MIYHTNSTFNDNIRNTVDISCTSMLYVPIFPGNRNDIERAYVQGKIFHLYNECVRENTKGNIWLTTLWSNCTARSRIRDYRFVQFCFYISPFENILMFTFWKKEKGPILFTLFSPPLPCELHPCTLHSFHSLLSQLLFFRTVDGKNKCFSFGI